MRSFALLTALLALDAASAFSPREAFTTGLWGVPKETTTTGPLHSVAGDDNFEGLNLKKLLSAKQLKRMARINKRKANQANKPAAVKESPRSTPKKASSGRKDPVKIIIAGAPASGNGTQCEGIQSKFGVVHLSTGDMLRAAVEAQTEVGKLAKEYMDGGKLVPDEVIIGVVSNREAYPRRCVVIVDVPCVLTVDFFA
jgi:adenylate kinase